MKIKTYVADNETDDGKVPSRPEPTDALGLEALVYASQGSQQALSGVRRASTSELVGKSLHFGPPSTELKFMFLRKCSRSTKPRLRSDYVRSTSSYRTAA